MKTRSTEDPPVWGTPEEEEIEVRAAVTAIAQFYILAEIKSTRRPQKEFFTKADLYDSNEVYTGTVSATAQDAVLDAIMSDVAQPGENYMDQSERLAVDLLKGKGKMPPDAEKM